MRTPFANDHLKFLRYLFLFHFIISYAVMQNSCIKNNKMLLKKVVDH